MSWPVAAYGLLGLALLGGFAWYERSRPDARVVALVAALAALAALGRIAFAAVPNVKPSTDIVIIAGYALGGAPGFTVGAVTGLASNFFFGQGPWTPWQMLGWGLCGVIGALAAHLARGRPPRRWPLALLCGGLGFAFTALGDFGDWVTYSTHSLSALGAYLGSGVGFDAISGGSCVLFALLFGPALARSLSRFTRRLEIHWVTPLLLGAVALSLTHPASAAASPGPSASIGYLERAPLSSPLFSGWAALGLEAEHVTPPARLLRYIASAPGDDPGSVERTVLALAPTGAPVGGLLARLHPRPSIDEQTNLTAFAVLALRAGHEPVPAATLHWLAAQEDADGGFNFATAGAGSDIDDTGAVLEALGDVPRAVRFLRANENPDGGFPADPGGVSNAQSTAFAVQGLIAAGQQPSRAIAYLRRLIQPNGSIDYSAGTPQTPEWVTGEALMGIAAAPLPLPALAVGVRVAHPARHRAPSGPASQPPPARPTIPWRVLLAEFGALIRALSAL